MVMDQIEARGVRDKRVLEVMRRVKRHLFVPQNYKVQAYADHPLPIGEGQTISQPYMVALMTELLALKGNEKFGLLKELGYSNMYVKCGDGFLGWPDKAPFDAIIVTCAPEDIPPALIEQLAEGGRLVIPER